MNLFYGLMVTSCISVFSLGNNVAQDRNMLSEVKYVEFNQDKSQDEKAIVFLVGNNCHLLAVESMEYDREPPTRPSLIVEKCWKFVSDYCSECG